MGDVRYRNVYQRDGRQFLGNITFDDRKAAFESGQIPMFGIRHIGVLHIRRKLPKRYLSPVDAKP